MIYSAYLSKSLYAYLTVTSAFYDESDISLKLKFNPSKKPTMYTLALANVYGLLPVKISLSYIAYATSLAVVSNNTGALVSSLEQISAIHSAGLRVAELFGIKS